MKKLICTLFLFALSAFGQLTPANGSTLYAGLPANFCWTLNGSPYILANFVFSTQPNSGNFLALPNDAPSLPQQAGFLTASGCWSITPTTTGTIYVHTYWQKCWSNCGSPDVWTQTYPVVAAPTPMSSLTGVYTAPQNPSGPDDFADPPLGPDIAQGLTTGSESSQCAECPLVNGVLPYTNLAFDGNTDGNYYDGSITHTGFDWYPFNEADFGQPADIQTIVIWNRTDCCMDRLSDYDVFLSNTPFLDTDTPSTLVNRPGTWHTFQTAYPNPSTTLDVGGVSARYIRVQLTTQNYLSLAEVQVFGSFDGGGLTPQLLKAKRVRLSNNSVVEIPRGDLANIGELTYQTSSSSGAYTYVYQFDNREVGVVKLAIGGKVRDMGIVSNTRPSGWSNGLAGSWFAAKNPERSASAQYTLVSNRLPGVMPMYFQTDIFNISSQLNGGPAGDFHSLPFTGKNRDDQLMIRETSIEGNSVKRYVMGPVFAEGVSRDDVMAKVKIWVNSYGFGFLQPLLEGGSLADLAPSTQLEKDIVSSLAAVLQ